MQQDITVSYDAHHSMLERALFYIAVVCSVLSNFPIVLGTVLESVFKVMWALPFFYIFIVKNTRMLWKKELLPFYLLAIAFFLYCFLCESVTGVEYVGTDLNNIVISSLVAITSYAYWKGNASESSLKQLSYLLLACGVLLGSYIYFEYLVGSDITSRLYAVKNKNSIGQIVFCCALIPFLTLRNGNILSKIVLYTAITVLTAIVLMTKSRATIIGVFFVIGYFIFTKSSLKVKVYSLLFIAAFVMFVLSNENVYNIIVNGILLGGRDVSNMNDLTSGRVILISKCFEGISENPWFGNGNKYMDCMPVIMLYQYGICGAMLIFVFLTHIGRHIILKTDRSPANLVALLLFGCFMLNSLFEAYPPFGPGIKCFLLWVFIGFSLARPVQDDACQEKLS